MSTEQTTKITVETTVVAHVEKVWKTWTTPADIEQWNNAHESWHTPWAKNDLRKGGEFTYRMEAKDGSFGFDFGGVYDRVDQHQAIAYTMGDGRTVRIDFEEMGDSTKVTETFDAENQNSHEMQRGGWLAILENFKRYTESH